MYTENQLRKIAIIELYIHSKKDKEVKVRPIFPKDFVKFNYAYLVAKKWFDSNVISIKNV